MALHRHIDLLWLQASIQHHDGLKAIDTLHRHALSLFTSHAFFEVILEVPGTYIHLVLLMQAILTAEISRTDRQNASLCVRLSICTCDEQQMR